jgi:hypothetical protein
MSEAPICCASCGRHIPMYRMHFFVSEIEVVCGRCRDWERPVLMACQTRESAHRYSKGDPAVPGQPRKETPK